MGELRRTKIEEHPGALEREYFSDLWQKLQCLDRQVCKHNTRVQKFV